MNNEEELCNIIDARCTCIGGYIETLVKDMVVAYTIINDIFVDTKAWDDLIDYLWEHLERLNESFNSKEEFDGYMATDLI